MKPLLAGTVIAAALLVGAAAPKRDAKPPSVWAKEPTAEQILASLPKTALASEGGGFAAMRCKVGAEAGLSGCRLVQESPSGIGFGQALLALAPEYRAKPPAQGGPAPGEDVIVPLDRLRMDTAADWRRRPSPEDLLVVWPKKAWARGVGGKARINCLVSVQGALYDCVVASESPAGENFGAAGIALTPQFLMRPATLGGKPVVSMVGIPLNFSMPPGMGPTSTFGSRGTVAAAMAWPEAPSYAEVAAAYPEKAREKHLGGRATLNCDFNKEGRLTRCDTIAEEPRGQGFAAAAKALAKQFRAFPTNASGATIAGAGVQLPVTFDPAMLAETKPVIGKAQWAGVPTAEELDAAFGKDARPGTSRVVISCVVQQGGRVDACKVESESPSGAGLGQAALTLAPHFRLSTWTAEGLPIVGGTVRIPIRYEGGEAKTAAAKP